MNPQRNAQGRGQLVLIVEDEVTLAETIELYLRHEGFRTERAADGERALELFRAAAPDLVLLDLGLPKVDGMEVLRRIRAASDVPVVILTARSEEVDELLGLGMGADDYLVKPVSARKLLARVKVALRRASPAAAGDHEVLRVGALEVDAYRVEVRYSGSPLELTPSEFKLVQHLARTPGRVIERAELYEAAIPDGDALERAVDIHVVNLRRKLREAGGGERLIRTVRGRGYVLEDRGP
ncbi:MAG: response regulator transcription factor [Trueperaceae bacterium]|nr:response regulator transcription factor [Trueperaceae bacterium]